MHRRAHARTKADTCRQLHTQIYARKRASNQQQLKINKRTKSSQIDLITTHDSQVREEMTPMMQLDLTFCYLSRLIKQQQLQTILGFSHIKQLVRSRARLDLSINRLIYRLISSRPTKVCRQYSRAHTKH